MIASPLSVSFRWTSPEIRDTDTEAKSTKANLHERATRKFVVVIYFHQQNLIEKGLSHDCSDGL